MSGFPRYLAKRFPGITAERKPPASTPMTTHLPMSPGSSRKAYSAISFMFLAMEVWPLGVPEAGATFSWPAVKRLIPPRPMPIRSAVIGLKTAKRGPMREYVARMESTPVVGVETRKERTEALDAPSFLSEVATGITPQEQRGSGTPKRAALMTGSIPRPPR